MKELMEAVETLMKAQGKVWEIRWEMLKYIGANPSWAFKKFILRRGD